MRCTVKLTNFLFTITVGKLGTIWNMVSNKNEPAVFCMQIDNIKRTDLLST